jgi:WD40 repeat protein
LNAGGPPVQRENRQSPTAGKSSQDKQPGPSGYVGIWETATGKKIGDFHTRNVPKRVAFSPSGDSILLVPQNGEAELLDVKTGKPRLDLGACAAAAFTPDGSLVITVSKDGNVCVRNVADGGKARRFQTSMRGVNRIAISGDGARLAVAMTHEWPTDAKQPMPSALGEAAVLDLADGRVLQSFLARNDAVDFVSFAPDGNRFLVGDGFWDPTLGRKIGNLCEKPVEVFCAAFAPDGKRAVVANHPRSKFLSGLFEGWFSRPRGNDVAVVVEIPSGKQTAKFDADSIIRDHVALGVGPDPDNAITVAEDKIGVWNLASGKNLLKFPVDGFVRAADVCPRRGWAGMLVDNVATTWWDVKTGEQVSAAGRKKGKVCSPGQPVPESGDKKEPQIDMSEDGQSLIVRMAGLSEGSRTLKIDKLPNKEIRSRGFDAEDNRFVFADFSSLHVGLWDVATGKMVREFASDNAFLAKPIKFSPDGRRLALGGEEGLTTIWETETGKKLAQLQFASPIMAMAFSPDGARLAAGCADRTVVIAPLTDGPKQVLRGHEGPVTAVAFRPDGALLLTACRNDGTARLWNLTEGKEIAKLISLNNRSDWLVMTPDGVYDGSEGGCKQMAFRVGEGLDVRLADLFSAEGYQRRRGLLKTIWNQK